MARFRNCTVGLLIALLAGVLSAEAGQSVTSEFVVFAGGKQIGREQVTVGTSGTDRIITSSGRHAPPIDITITRFSVRYSSDWQPMELSVDAQIGQRTLGLRTSFGVTTAINEITQGETTNAKTDQISARSIVLVNGFFGSYEALAARLVSAAPGTELPVYVAPQGEAKAVVKAIRDEQLQFPGGTVVAKVYEVAFQNAGAMLPTTITVDPSGRLARIDMASAGLSVIRSDVASVAVRRQTTRNATDADVSIPANGFTLAGTLTLPTQAAGRMRQPAVILTPGARATDRDEILAGVAMFQQIAGALADKGFMVLRYDRRGFGQSGGRVESATLEDSADDLLAAFRWLKKRREVDERQISVLGHGEGGAVAMIAAARQGDISSLILVAAPGVRGSEMILEQQAQQLAAINATEEERAAKIELQKRIHLAVISGVGWESLPANLRKQADTAWFRSLLTFDPAAVIPRVKQPVLILRGALDTEVPARYAERLADLARSRKRKAPVDVVTIPGVNHLLVPAKTGAITEYPNLPVKTVAPAVAERIAEFARR
jgi:uncharacterized protein